VHGLFFTKLLESVDAIGHPNDQIFPGTPRPLAIGFDVILNRNGFRPVKIFGPSLAAVWRLN
jgi:hypothetical protein